MEILQKLYDSEINFRLSCFFDAGFEASLGDEINGFKASDENFETLEEAIDHLVNMAKKFYPESEFSRTIETGGR